MGGFLSLHPFQRALPRAQWRAPTQFWVGHCSCAHRSMQVLSDDRAPSLAILGGCWLLANRSASSPTLTSIPNESRWAPHDDKLGAAVPPKREPDSVDQHESGKPRRSSSLIADSANFKILALDR